MSLRERLAALANTPGVHPRVMHERREWLLVGARMALEEARAACKTTLNGQVCYVVSAAHADDAIRALAEGLDK